MLDGFNRNIDYMRVSLTDRCNLRCKYCMPEDVVPLAHHEILRYEEILRICKITAELGIRTIKIPGGEPLVRIGCLDFLHRLKALPGIQHVTLTTNAVLLAPIAKDLAEIGISGINISLDTMNSETYRHMTGRDEYARAWEGLQAAVNAGLRVKVNCVPLRGYNDNELSDIARLAEQMPVDVRFIEIMPMGSNAFSPIPGDSIVSQLKEIYPDLSESRVRRGFGPAHYYTGSTLKGAIGFIDAVSHCFCDKCNRIRLTSEGYLKPCLYHGNGLALRPLLRGDASDSELHNAISSIIYAKPREHAFFAPDPEREMRRMSQIGG